MNFEMGKGKVGHEYGIQVYHNNLKIILRIIKTTATYWGLKFSSHHGEQFNLNRFHNYNLSIVPSRCGENGEGKLLLIFRTKYWTTTFYEHGNGENRKIGIPVEQKKVFIGLVKKAGFEVIDAWNNDNESDSVSVLTDTNINYDRNALPIEVEEMVLKFNEFDNTGELPNSPT